MNAIALDQVRAPSFTHLFTMRADLAPSLDSGEGPQGRRAFNTVSKGEFAGPRLNGEILPGSGDWMATRGGVRVIDARVVLKTDDGALIHMTYGGRAMIPAEIVPQILDAKARHLVDPARYYFRTAPMFETGAEKYAWLNGIVCAGIGRITEDGVGYDVFELT